MAVSILGEAAVRLRPETSGFAGEAESGVLGPIGSIAKKATGLFAAAFAGKAVVEGLKSFYDAAAESAKIGALTTQVIKSTGGAAQLSADQVGDLATAISNRTGVDDEAIQSGENLLLTFTNIKDAAGAGNDIFSQTTKIMTDMSVALGTDASGSALQLGKALNDPVKGISALSRVGVSFTAQQKDQVAAMVAAGDTMGAQRLILGELSKEFGGAAEAASTPLEKLQVNLGNIQEAMGAKLIPIVGAVSSFIVSTLIPAFTWVGDTVGAVTDIIFKGDFTGGPFEEDSPLVGALFTIHDAFVVVHDFVRDNLTPILAGLGTVVAFIAGPVVFGLLSSAAGAVAGALGTLLSPVLLVGLAIGGLVAIFTKAYQESQPLRDAVDQLKSAFGVFFDAFSAADAGGGLSGFFSAIGAGLQAAWPVVTSALAGIGSALWGWIQPQIGPALAAIGGFIGTLISWWFTTALPWLASTWATAAVGIISWIWDALPGMLTAIGNFVTTLVTWAQTTGIPWLTAALATWGQAFIDWIGPQIVPLLGKLLSLMGAVVSWIFSTGLPWLLTAVENLAMALVNWIAPQIPGLLGKLGAFLGTAVGWLLGTGIPMLVGALLLLAVKLISWILPALPGLLGNLLLFFGRVVWWVATTGLPMLVSALFNMATSAVGAFIRAIVSGPLISQVIGFFTSLPGRILSALSGLGHLLVGVGGDLIRGLVNGISAAAGFVGDVAGSIVRSIRSFINTQVIGRLNSLLEFTIMGVTVNPPDIPTLHSGGVFSSGSSTGEGLAMLRDSELVVTPEQRATADSLLRDLLDGRTVPGATPAAATSAPTVTIEEHLHAAPAESLGSLAAQVTQGVVWNLNNGITRTVGATAT